MNMHVPLSAAAIERPPPVLRSWTLRTSRVGGHARPRVRTLCPVWSSAVFSVSVWFAPTSMWWGPHPSRGGGKHVRVGP